jgi:hypothetical protein
MVPCSLLLPTWGPLRTCAAKGTMWTSRLRLRSVSKKTAPVEIGTQENRYDVINEAILSGRLLDRHFDHGGYSFYEWGSFDWVVLRLEGQVLGYRTRDLAQSNWEQDSSFVMSVRASENIQKHAGLGLPPKASRKGIYVTPTRTRMVFTAAYVEWNIRRYASKQSYLVTRIGTPWWLPARVPPRWF